MAGRAVRRPELGQERPRRGWVELRRGRRRERLAVEELAPADAVPVLQEYYRQTKVTRPFFAVGLDASDEEWRAEAPRHAAFRLRKP